MRSTVITASILLGIVAAVIAGWLLFAPQIAERHAGAQKVLHDRSVIHVGLEVRYAHGGLADEQYVMDDDDGVSRTRYRVVGRRGLTITIESLPRETHEVVFLFEQLVSDGIWELRDRPPRGNRDVTYRVDVAQTTGGKSGSHAFTFTDPHYWATTGGHQFHIHLDRNKPVPDLLQLTSTVIVEPRYGKVVNDFRDYGTSEFRARVAAAQKRARQGG